MFDQLASAHRYGDAIIRSEIILMVITTIALVLRFATKSTTKSSLGIDDAMILIAQLFRYGTAAMNIRAATIGKQLSDIMDPEFAEFAKFTYVGGTIYAPSVLFISLSVLYFYRRIFPIPTFQRIADIFIVLHVLWALACGLTSIFMCTPIWIPSSDAATFMTNIDKCIDYPLFFVIILSFELLLSVAVLTLPLREIVKLQLDSNSKWMVACVFLLGGISIISGIIRLQQTYLPGDPFIDFAGDMFWISIHEATALIAASLPLYRPLMRTSIRFMSSSIRKLSTGGSSTSQLTEKKSANYSTKDYNLAPSERSQRESVEAGNATDEEHGDHRMAMQTKCTKAARKRSHEVV